MNSRNLIPAALVAALALPASAGAHVTLQPKAAPAGAYVVEAVRVPNERDDAATTKVAVRLPHGFTSASYEPVRGWTTKVTRARLDQPIEIHGEQLTEEVRQITWTARSTAEAIQPGQFRDFPISVQIPGKAGDTLTFKALQTYDDGEVVRWIGAADADKPAPQVAVTAAQDEGHGAKAPTADVTPTAVEVPAAAAGDSSDDGASKGLAVAALVAGVGGLLAGGLALLRRRA